VIISSPTKALRNNASLPNRSPQVYPVNPQAKALFKKAKRVIVMENNQSAQFSRVLEQELSIKTDYHIQKFNGLQFSVAELASAIKEVL
jgi:pyruvate/2-oxoacid:ferredoxin oxidoreductase alpha subunit